MIHLKSTISTLININIMKLKVLKHQVQQDWRKDQRKGKWPYWAWENGSCKTKYQGNTWKGIGNSFSLHIRRGCFKGVNQITLSLENQRCTQIPMDKKCNGSFGNSMWTIHSQVNSFEFGTFQDKLF